MTIGSEGAAMLKAKKDDLEFAIYVTDISIVDDQDQGALGRAIMLKVNVMNKFLSCLPLNCKWFIFSKFIVSFLQP